MPKRVRIKLFITMGWMIDDLFRYYSHIYHCGGMLFYGAFRCPIECEHSCATNYVGIQSVVRYNTIMNTLYDYIEWTKIYIYSWGSQKGSYNSTSRESYRTPIVSILEKLGLVSIYGPPFHFKDKAVVRPSYLKHGDPYTGKTTS